MTYPPDDHRNSRGGTPIEQDSRIINGSMLAIAAFVIIGFVTGHLMGGQDHGHGAVLGLATATRHPGLAMAIATTNFPTERIGGVLLLYLLVGAIVGIPYVKWAKSRPAATSPRGGHPGVRPAGGSVR